MLICQDVSTIHECGKKWHYTPQMQLGEVLFYKTLPLPHLK